VIELDGFAVAFPGFSLGPLSLSIRRGERVALVGPNGAGKSTTLRGIAGLLPQGYGGRVRVHDEEVSDAGPEIRKTVGLLPERLGGFGWMTVGEHLAFLRAFHPTWDDVRAAELAERLELPTRTKLANLSKGMRVKLSFVSVEAYRPPVLLLDEPTSGIDPVMRRGLLALLQECAPSGGGRTVVFSSHILEDVEAVSDRVLLLREGSLVGDESVADLRGARGGASVSEELLRRLGSEAAG
jgi:ABC-2 type transport system ATP-binding protein